MPTLRKQITSYISEECTPDEFMKYVNDVKLYVDNKKEIYEIDVYQKCPDYQCTGMQQRMFSLPVSIQLFITFLRDDSDKKLMEYVKNNIPEDIYITV